MPLHRLVPALAACALAACATGTATSSTGPADPTTASAGPAPDFTLRDLDGRDVRLSDFAGQVVVLDFWATWCVPCEAAIPHLQKLYEKYKERGFTVLAVSMDGPETIASVGPFAQRYGLTFPVLLDEETKVTALFNPKRTAPLTLFVDRQGRLAHTRQGYSPGDEALVEAEIVKLLGP